MKNITLALDEQTLAAGRAYAQRHGTTLNSLVRDLLRRATVDDQNRTVAELFRLMDAHAGDSRGETWSREDLYVRSS